ncbi:MAG: OmpH/Skp family outer membrane protein [Gemmatimonadaceae bacterium]
MAVVIGSASAGAQAPTKIAFVNTQTIFAQAPGRAEAEQAWNAESGKYQEQLKRMNDSLNTLVESYQKAEATLTAAQKDTRQKAIRAKQEEYQARAQQLEQQAGSRRDELLQPIMERIQKAVDDIRAEDGYAMILNREASGGMIVSADKNLDITDRVVARLRTMGTTPVAKPAAPAAGPAGVTRPKP